MNRYIKYSKSYRLAIFCLALSIAATIWILIAATYFYPSTLAMISMFFVPTGVAVAILLAIHFWYRGESRRFGWYSLEEKDTN